MESKVKLISLISGENRGKVLRKEGEMQAKLSLSRKNPYYFQKTLGNFLTSGATSHCHRCHPFERK